MQCYQVWIKGCLVEWPKTMNSTSLPNHSMCMCLYVSLCSLYAIPVWTVIENILLVPLYTLMVSDFLSQREDHESNLLISFLFFLSEKHEMGLLSTLLQWNKFDPPSRMEQLRNDRICKLYQHNRNPFVDHPEYANFIWKNVTSSNLAT